MDLAPMGSTHSANPLVCAVGHANLQALLEDGIIDDARRLGVQFHEELRAMQARHPDLISHVTGVGMVAALILSHPETGEPLPISTDVCITCLQRGLLVVHTGRESLKLTPPLCISEAALLEGLAVLEQALLDVVAGTAPLRPAAAAL